MSSDQRTSVVPSDLLQRIFENLVNKSRRHTSSRQSRKKPDAFRGLIRHMSEVTYESTWDQIRPLVVNKEEFKALESEEERMAVFDKVIRRLKEKRDDEKRHREREGSTRGSSKREREESTHRDGRHESKSRRRYDDDGYERSREHSRPRSRERRDSRDRDQDKKYRDRSKGRSSRRDELDYGDEPRREKSSKRRSDEDLRLGDRKVFSFF
jgi:pre-mRNA-processing factor 40